jgi:NADH:ubiquinone oxidoreductase subunit F (NADH-binding)
MTPAPQAVAGIPPASSVSSLSSAWWQGSSGSSPGAEPLGRLLSDRPLLGWSDHRARWGPLPAIDPARLIRQVDAAGIRGRGGAGFPTARKLAAVAAAAGRRRLPAVVLVNGCEGDPTSTKDAVLIGRSPHLVIDGALAVAAAVRADRALLAVHPGPTASALAAALAQRSDASAVVDVVVVPPRYIASEATALVRFLDTGDARPAGRLTPVWERGAGGRPTLVLNAETVAEVALLARFGADWFAAVGAQDEPGTALVTVIGAVPRPGVLEVPIGASVRAILRAAGAADPSWVLVGGLAGRWVDVRRAGDIVFSTAGLAGVGAAFGVGSLVVLPPGGCVLDETARILRHHADAGARQCGPCMFGLPAIAADVAALAAGERAALDRLHRRLPMIDGRGACGHPDGAVALAASALRTLTGSEREHLALHLTARRCSAPAPVVPLGGSFAGGLPAGFSAGSSGGSSGGASGGSSGGGPR